VTAAGRVTLLREYPRCPRCGDPCYPLDDRLGLAGLLSPRAERLACLAAASWSFDVAADRLGELAGVRLDGETLRRHALPAAARLARRRDGAAPAAAAFAKAAGDWEFLTDGVFVPTRGGWRELKLGLFQRRPRGKPASSAEWATRPLPPPAASAAYARPEGCDDFAARWRGWAAGLGLKESAGLTVVADGAPWIWAAAAGQFPGAAGLLDVFHACLHVPAAAAVLLGEGSAAAAAWADRVRGRLLADGWPGLCDALAPTPAGPLTAAGREAIDGVLGYFAAHTGRVGYAGRLASGRSIGSGAVEGLARRAGGRLKVPGRGWIDGSVDPMATLVCTVQTAEWDALWNSMPA
jgi:hypothetical protein